jgi:YVTN family beta-propeller protein
MFVTADTKRELQAISTSTGAILATVPVLISVSGTSPLELAIRPDGSQVYVLAPQDRPDSLLLAVDSTTYLVTASLNLPAVAGVGPLLVSPDGTQLYFEVGLVNQYIQVIDTASLKPVAQIPVNESPSGLCVTPSGMILMTDTKNELLVLDPKTDIIVNRFSLSTSIQILAGTVVSSPDSTTAYISFGGNSILAVDIATGMTVFSTAIGYTPSQFAISSDGRKLYSIDFSLNAAPSVSEFQIQTRKPVQTVRQLGPLSSLALSRDGSTLYVLNADVSAIIPVDVSTQMPGSASLAGIGINSLAIPPSGKTVWASSYAFAAGGDILTLNRATGQLNFIAGPSGGLTFSPSGKVLYVASPSKVIALDAQSAQPVGKYFAGNLQNIGQAIPSPDGTRLYVSKTFVSGSPTPGTTVLPAGEIVVLDTATFKPVSVVSIPHGLGVFALTADGSTLVCTSNRGEVHVIGTATGAVTETITLTPSNGVLEGLALSNDGSTAYVTDAQNNLLFEVSLATQSQQATVSVGSTPLAVAITPDGSEAWILTAVGLETVNLAAGQVSGPVRLPGTPSAIVFAR